MIELMVTVALVAILATVAVPSFETLIKNNRLTSTANGLLTDIYAARSEAIKRASTVTVCGSSNGSDCDTSDWTKGWLVYVDSNGNGSPDPSEILRVGDKLDGDLSLNASGFANNSLFRYDARGQLQDLDGGWFTLCDSRGASEARAVVVTNIGRPGMASDTDGDGTPNDPESGNNVSCS